MSLPVAVPNKIASGYTADVIAVSASGIENKPEGLKRAGGENPPRTRRRDGLPTTSSDRPFTLNATVVTCNESLREGG